MDNNHFCVSSPVADAGAAGNAGERAPLGGFPDQLELLDRTDKGYRPGASRPVLATYSR